MELWDVAYFPQFVGFRSIQMYLWLNRPCKFAKLWNICWWCIFTRIFWVDEVSNFRVIQLRSTKDERQFLKNVISKNWLIQVPKLGSSGSTVRRQLSIVLSNLNRRGYSIPKVKLTGLGSRAWRFGNWKRAPFCHVGKRFI